MKLFAQLFEALDATTSTRAKVAALASYFSTAAPADAAWALYFLAGGRPRQTVPTALIKTLAQEMAGIPTWLFEESYAVVGDLAETVTHLLHPPTTESDRPLHLWIEDRLLPLKALPVDTVKARLAEDWMSLDTTGRFLLTKLIGGQFRVGVSRNLVVRALAQTSGLDAKLLTQRMMGFTDKTNRPDAAGYLRLFAAPGTEELNGRPYPFFLAHALQSATDTLGTTDDWLAEWKWDGIRAQLVLRQGQQWLWSRGEELLTDRFPEFEGWSACLPSGTVLDGEVLIWRDGQAASFAELQKRIGRQNISKKMLVELPASFMAYDLLEAEGVDLRSRALHERRALLEVLVAQAQERCPETRLFCSPLVTAQNWDALDQLRQSSRQRGVEGLMLKQRSGQYGVGRTKDVGLWWKWKLQPYTVDAVLIYAQSGHGRRANLYTDYTFAVWDLAESPPKLVPFAKAYSGLTDEEMVLVDQRIRKTTIERFGPVRSVEPSLVIELAFENIQVSSRHKCGLAVRFPRMLRLRWDKPVAQADSLDTLKSLLSPTAVPRSA